MFISCTQVKFFSYQNQNSVTQLFRTILVDMSSPYSLWSRLVSTAGFRIAAGAVSVASRAMSSVPSLLPLNDIRKLQGVFRKVRRYTCMKQLFSFYNIFSSFCPVHKLASALGSRAWVRQRKALRLWAPEKLLYPQRFRRRADAFV